MNIASKTLFGAGLICFIFGCSESNRPVETAESEDPSDEYQEQEAIPVSGPPEESPQETRSATDTIAEARCARESTCNNIGDDKKFSSTDDCLARIRADWRDDLNSRECPGGVNEAELNECVTAIRNEECTSPFDTLSRLAECGSGQICID